MTDKEASFLERWREELPVYEAWGDYVAKTIQELIGQKICSAELEIFFRIPIRPRTKSEASLLSKAFHRGKGYASPYDDIEDKIGLRIVVLFDEEIRSIEDVLASFEKWQASKARDFEDERQTRPFEFDYQSKHYIVRLKNQTHYKGIDIPANIPCEIQIRTLLQHAYSELTHDTIYKPSVQAQPDVKRAAAKSMALIEATGDYFTEVRKKLKLIQDADKRLSILVSRIYGELTGLKSEISPFNTLLIDHFKKWVAEDPDQSLNEFLREKSFLAERIKERAAADFLYRQPAIILVYWSVSHSPRMVPYDAPLTDEELAPIYSDLGLRLPSARL
jgi:putative GTP pyrophosphokinase